LQPQLTYHRRGNP